MAGSKKRSADPSAALATRPPKRQAAKSALSKLGEIKAEEESFQDDESEADDTSHMSELSELSDLGDIEDVPTPDEGQPDDDEEAAPAGFKKWVTTTRLSSGAPLTEVAKVTNTTWQFTQTVEVHHRDAFTLRPLIMTKGALKDRHVLVLEPVSVEAADQTPSFHFLDLPGEIRSIIYQHAFNESGVIEMSSYKPVRQPRRPVRDTFRTSSESSVLRRRTSTWNNTLGKWMGQEPSALTILALSRSVRREAAPIIYGKNNFKFKSLGDMELFLDQIGSMRQHLRTLQLHAKSYAQSYSMSYMQPVFDSLKHAKQLRTIWLDTDSTDDSLTYGGLSYRPSIGKIYHHMKPLIKRLHQAQVRGERSRSVLDLVQVTRSRKCRKCDSTSEIPNDVPCRSCGICHDRVPTTCPKWCMESAAACVQKTKSFRRLIADDLGIVDDEAESDGVTGDGETAGKSAVTGYDDSDSEG